MNYFITPTIYTISKGNLKIEKNIIEQGCYLTVYQKENGDWKCLGIVELLHEGIIGSLPECEKVFIPDVLLNLQSCDKNLFPHLEDIVNILNIYLSKMNINSEKEEVVLDEKDDNKNVLS